MNSKKEYIKSYDISDLKTYTLNGFPQKVLLEGKSAANPIILSLHGGPGSPIPFCAGSRGLFPEITKEYTMVYWDQLGCGINDYPIDESFSIDSYVAMTIDLIRCLQKEFPNRSINLFGVSWGSILAAKTAHQIPDEIHRVLIYGQVTRNLLFDKEVFEQLEASRLSEKERSRIKEIKSKASHTKEDIKLVSTLIRKYTEGYTAKNGGNLPMIKMLWELFTSPDYTLKNLKAMMINGTLKNNSLYKELLEIDLTGILSEVKVPYLILQGSTDIVTSLSYVQSLVKTAQNSNLHLRIIPDSGHIPGAKGMEAIITEGFDFLKNGTL